MFVNQHTSLGATTALGRAGPAEMLVIFHGYDTIGRISIHVLWYFNMAYYGYLVR